MKVIDQVIEEDFALYQADSIEVMNSMPESSIDLAIFSPPFSDLFVYSSSERDMGNCSNVQEFLEMYKFFSDELFRVMRPGRIVAVHAKPIPYMKFKDGFVGWYDLPGDLRKVHETSGFHSHAEVIVTKNPVMEMQRTHAMGLLHKELLKDSTVSRVAMPDKVVLIRKPKEAGENVIPVTHTAEEFPVPMWQKWAESVWNCTEYLVWDDINQSEVLNRDLGRDERDEKHICPIQLDLVRRLLFMYSNRGELIMDPFTGIGSVGYESLKMERRFVGGELKHSYFHQAVKNIRDGRVSAADMFGDIRQ